MTTIKHSVLSNTFQVGAGEQTTAFIVVGAGEQTPSIWAPVSMRPLVIWTFTVSNGEPR